jgi:hypothetical protein
MDARNALVETIGKIMWNAEKDSLQDSYVVLTCIVNYIEQEPEIEKERLLSLLRNITSNLQMIRGFR